MGKRASIQLSFEAFNKIYEENCKVYPTYETAYNATEKTSTIITGERKWEGWQSFRQRRYMVIKNHK